MADVTLRIPAGQYFALQGCVVKAEQDIKLTMSPTQAIMMRPWLKKFVVRTPDGDN